MRFSVGVNYRSRTGAATLWHDFDAGAVRDDLTQIATAGLDAVRIFVPWDDPRLRLDDLVQAIDLAGAAGLRVLPSLTAAPGIGNIYEGALLERQIAFVRAAGERVRAHPAIVAWDVGAAFSSVCAPARGKVTSGEHASEPVAERALAAWCRSLAEAVRASSSLPATVGTTSDDLTHDNNVRLGSLCAPLAFASMQGSNVSLDFARDRTDPEAIPFLALLTAAFSFKPVLMTGFGNPGAPYYTDDENAAYCTAVLERLHADGRLGAYWSGWPGSTSPVTAALANFGRQARTVMKAADMPMISSTYYYRTLPLSTKTLYDAYLGFVAERRAAM